MKILMINSQGHWQNGWMTFPESQAKVMEILEKSGCTVEAVEVSSPSELTAVLQSVSPETLVWANAYWVNDANGEEVGLVEQIEKYGLPMVGSDLQTLNLLLEKDSCQRKLTQAGIPVPQFMVLHHAEMKHVHSRIERSGIAFPMVVKPTKESRSQGVTKVEHIAQAMDAIHANAARFPFSQIIIEEFLPTDDITCGYLRMGDEIMILPSFNYVEGMDCAQEVFGEKFYLTPPEHEHQVIIRDQNILDQLAETLPEIAEILGVVAVTRIDARMDAEGTLKVFDINGMPGLNFPISALIKQCFSHFPGYPQDYLFECLIHTILIENFLQHGMKIPPKMRENHLFKLESETVIRRKAKACVR